VEIEILKTKMENYEIERKEFEKQNKFYEVKIEYKEKELFKLENQRKKVEKELNYKKIMNANVIQKKKKEKKKKKGQALINKMNNQIELINNLDNQIKKLRDEINFYMKNIKVSKGRLKILINQLNSLENKIIKKRIKDANL